jgi:hypothetical protein
VCSGDGEQGGEWHPGGAGRLRGRLYFALGRYNRCMKFLGSEVTPPEFDIGMMLLGGMFLLPIGVALLFQHDSRQAGAVCLVISVVNLAHAWRAWRCLPGRSPPRFRIRDLLLLMTILALVLGAAGVLSR